MASTLRKLFDHNLKRCLSTTTVNSSQSHIRQGRFMRKMLNGDVGKRKWVINKVRPAGSPVTTEKFISKHVTRRTTVLNKLFMEHITGLMSTGEASTELVGRRIEVSDVKVTPDFQMVLVFWSAKNDDEQFETEKLLNECAFDLRHELSQLQLMGQVPMIKFVKDKKYSALTQLEKVFNVADYGDDHEPAIPNFVVKEKLMLNVNLPPSVKEQIIQLESEEAASVEDESAFDVDLPPMRHDVLGLDHYAIMTRVKLSIKKSYDASKDYLHNVTTIQPTQTRTSIHLSAFETAKNESQAFTEFLVKRKNEERRKIRRENDARVLADDEETENYDSYNDEELLYENDDGEVFDDIDFESSK